MTQENKESADSKPNSSVKVEEVKENPDKKPKMVETKTYKKILLTVHSFVLLLSLALFICGLYTNLRHLAFHQAWHASYGIFNASVMCIIVGVIGIVISVTGKKLF